MRARIRSINIILALVGTMAFCRFAQATLGESEAVIQARAKSARLQISEPKPHKGGRVYEHADSLSQSKIKEFASASGVVYALSWSGKSHPDISGIGLLGKYAEEFKTAKLTPQMHQYRLPFRRLASDQLRIVYYYSRTDKTMKGHIYVPELKPEEITEQDLH